MQGISADGNHLIYDIETLPGSGGAPCLNAALEPIALHLASSKRKDAPRGAKTGVLISAVLKDLESHGLGAPAHTALV